MTDFTSSRRLCDDDGIVSLTLADPQPVGDEFLTYRGLHNRLAARSGRELATVDFVCSGSAHFGADHIRCTSPAHDAPDRLGESDPGSGRTVR